ncbi:cobalt transporter CbiM [Caldichromatium japonicum]|uniref:Cobalt transporter CbiM n=1 Tax=Caldichromatium japonicum TaxID=2699430 RepID=A0A6G7VCG4_9GAMM|nr:cobalt transporter CbiM [Caldichromatium japonicum]QIK37642.1 cobalt transporter CbiM [Caldichromatium japonicum]
MAHIPDGVLGAPVLIAGALASAGLTAVALRRLQDEHLPAAAVLTSTFFVASLIHLPLGPTSIHPLLNGLMGLILGWTAVPAILVALALQAVFFGFGGLWSLGVNTLNMAVPALLCGWLLAPRLKGAGATRASFIGFLASCCAVLLTGLLVALSLAASGELFQPAARLIFLTYAPLALIEGIVTASILGLVQQVAPELLVHPREHPDA